jgi:hypothetical protein
LETISAAAIRRIVGEAFSQLGPSERANLNCWAKSSTSAPRIRFYLLMIYLTKLSIAHTIQHQGEQALSMRNIYNT